MIEAFIVGCVLMGVLFVTLVCLPFVLVHKLYQRIRYGKEKAVVMSKVDYGPNAHLPTGVLMLPVDPIRKVE